VNRYAQIIIISKTKAIDNLFTYRIPDDYLGKEIIGLKVLVPFGRGNTVREGFVFSTTDECSYKRIKKIKHFLVDDISITTDDIQLINFIRNEYLCTYTEALQLIVPSGTQLKRKTIYTFKKEINDLTDKEKNILEFIKKNKKVDQSEISKSFKNSSKYLKNLEDQNLIKKKYEFSSVVSEKEKELIFKVIDNEKILEIKESIPANYVAQIRLIDFLLENEEKAEVSMVKKKLSIAKSVIDRIIEMGIADIMTVRDKRHIDHHFDIESDEFKTLNVEQRKAFEEILHGYHTNNFKSFLLHGVTGSGKTEIYMHLVREVLKNNETVIILVPEIALTPQMIERFVNRFGDEIAILHSKLSLGEAFDQWKDIKSGRKKIIIGARSAIFSPVRNLGMVIIDEEHENTYKSTRNPKYETYDIARFRLLGNKGLLISGSATPRIDSYERVNENEMTLIKLEKRINSREMPPVEIVDMRDELSKGNKTIFSEKLYKGIEERLRKKEQSIIFLNRKGYSSFVSCRKCGFKLECPNCEISLTYHKKRNVAECSYCEHKSFIPKACPECGSEYFKLFGIGTEKVEEITKKTFKNAKVGRLDSQTTRKKGSLNKIIQKFEDETYDILIGTQMVTKGFDFENVTLVGILAADLIINFPDFSSSERAFQLITQVAGRAGRGSKKGEVILQTYEPEHPALISASNHDYDSFLKEELKVRRVFEYPPFLSLINIIFYSEKERDLIKDTNRFKKYLEKEIDSKSVKIFGPSQALHSKIRGKYRYQIFLKVSKTEFGSVKNSVKKIIDENKFNVYISVDVQPRNLV
jgi:primosomal protein N' (replication factor Y)